MDVDVAASLGARDIINISSSPLSPVSLKSTLCRNSCIACMDPKTVHTLHNTHNCMKRDVIIIRKQYESISKCSEIHISRS